MPSLDAGRGQSASRSACPPDAGPECRSDEARARLVATRRDAEISGTDSGTANTAERRFPSRSQPRRAPLAPRPLLTANIRLKRNSRYLTQVMPPDTIFVTLTVSHGASWITESYDARRRRAAKETGARFLPLHAEAENAGGCPFLFSSPPAFSLSLSLSLLPSLRTSTTRTSRDARASTVRRQMHRTMYFCCCAVYPRCARNRPARAVTFAATRRGGLTSFRDEEKHSKNSREGDWNPFLQL